MSLDEQVRVLSRRVGVLEDEAEIARRLAGFDQRGAERERLYRFIEAEAANFTLTMLCRVCQVSRSAYYSWRAGGHGADQATWDEALLADAIFDTWRASRRAYGSPRVSVSLAKAGWKVNEKRVARLMGELAIAGKHGRRKLVTTRRNKDATPAPDLVQRDFSAERPDELWVGDITYVATGEGWLFVASVLDVFSRRLVGWSIADHLRTELCLDALQAACASRGRLRFVGTKFHSDYVEVCVNLAFSRFHAV